MPRTSVKITAAGRRASGRIKLSVLLALVIATAAITTDRMDFSLKLFSASAQQEQLEQNHQTAASDCDYLRNPEKFKNSLARHRDEVSRSTEMISGNLALQTETALISPQDIPRKNFVDNILFDRMGRDNVMSAPLSSDSEFIRRAYLDLTARIPSPDDVVNFLNDKNANKRDALVDKLIGTPEFIDKWTMFFGDLFKNNARATNVQRYTGGRDAFYTYIKNSLTTNKSYAQMASEMINANGDNFVAGEVNFIIGGVVPMGPAQDTMDGRAVNTAGMFLGINAVDCLLCHNGAGHLMTVNLWGSERTRLEAWGMSAFFARVQQRRQALSQLPNYAKFVVSENAAGEYQLNTNSGNRTARNPVNGKSTVDPRFILTGAGLNQGETRRQGLARLVTSDKQFARAAVNYIWEKMMVEALVSPSNSFDPARLDPNAQLPEGWSLQPANAELLEALAQEFIKQNYNLRSLIGLIAKSNAYQLSSQYPGNWSLALVPYYARKYVRRLDAEEIHDAVLKATGVGAAYQLRDTLGNNTSLVNWAMQLPDTSEPRGNNQALSFLNAFVRGDRDVKPRSLEPSIMQALNLMNHQLVMTRIHQANNGSTVAKLLANPSLTPEQLITQLYLSTMSRNPTATELEKLTPIYSSNSRKDATEAIQWALINKMDFIFNY